MYKHRRIARSVCAQSRPEHEVTMQIPQQHSTPTCKPNFKIGDFVHVKKGSYKGLYAVIVNNSYQDEFKINYYAKQGKWWVLKQGDIDSKMSNELTAVKNHTIDTRNHLYFDE